MVSDQEIANGVESLLRQSDPNTFTSFSSVVEHLESKLGLDLTTKTGLIRSQIEFLLRPPPPPTTALLHTQTQTQTLVQQQQQPKDQHHLHHHHFALQTQTHNPNLQFQNTHTQIPPHFALQHQHQLQHHQYQQHQRHHGEINFQCPPPPPQHQHQHQQQHHPLVQPQPHSRAHPQTQKSNAAGTPKESAPKRRGGPGGLNKVCGVSPELQAIVGEPTMPRTQIVKQLWAYIRKNNLQDPSNKRKIICNDELRLVFETDCTDMFKMNKLLAKHIIPLEPSKPVPVKKRQKVEAVEAVEAATPSEPTEAKPDLVIISDALAKFFGTGDREMLQEDALRRVWEYIQANHLQDPENSTVIICDAKLQELFGCESISALGVAEMVGHHLFKRS